LKVIQEEMTQFSRLPLLVISCVYKFASFASNVVGVH